LTILHGTLWSQLNWDNLLRRLDPVSHRSPYLLWLQWPHDRLRSQHWTSKLLLMLDWLLLVRGSMLLLLLRMLACLRMLTRSLLLWVLLLKRTLLLMWTWALLLNWMRTGLLCRVRAWLLGRMRTLLLGRLLRLLLLVWTRLLLLLRMLALLLQLMGLLTDEHLPHSLTPRLGLLLHQLEPLGLLTSHVRRAGLHHLYQLLASASR